MQISDSYFLVYNRNLNKSNSFADLEANVADIGHRGMVSRLLTPFLGTKKNY